MTPLLTRLKRYAEQNVREPWIPVKSEELLALIECTEVLQRIHKLDAYCLEQGDAAAALGKLRELGATDRPRDAATTLREELASLRRQVDALSAHASQWTTRALQLTDHVNDIGCVVTLGQVADTLRHVLGHYRELEIHKTLDILGWIQQPRR